MNDAMDCLVLSEAVAASLDDWHAKPALAPEFTLREIEELKVVVVPVELTYKNITRALKERTVKLQIGFMKRAKNEELDELLATVEKLGMGFLNKEFCGAKCVAVGFNPIYSADDLRERHQFTSVIELGFREVCFTTGIDHSTNSATLVLQERDFEQHVFLCSLSYNNLKTLLTSFNNGHRARL